MMPLDQFPFVTSDMVRPITDILQFYKRGISPLNTSEGARAGYIGGGSGEVIPIRPGLRYYGPNDFDIEGNSPGFRSGDPGLEKELRLTEKQKYDKALYDQKFPETQKNIAAAQKMVAENPRLQPPSGLNMEELLKLLRVFNPSLGEE